MFHLTSLLALLLSLSLSSLSTPLHKQRTTPPLNSHLSQIHQFPNNIWVENIAVRSNGNLLVTFAAPSPDVWEVDPSTHEARHIYTFPEATSVSGIAEYADDVFAVNVGNFSLETLLATSGSWSVWSIDMRGCAGEEKEGGWGSDGVHNAKVKKLTDLAEAQFLNGMASLPDRPSQLLIVDSGAGTVYSLDTTNAQYSLAISDVPALQPAPDSPVIIGINGIQFRPGKTGTLYWTNTFKDGHFGRIAIDPLTGHQEGPAEVLLDRKQSGAQDDFTFDSKGNAWLVGSPQDTVVKLKGGSWGFEVVVNDTEVIAGPTAGKFGRTERDAEVLYVVTDGGLLETLPQGIRGGAVVAVDTAVLH